MDLTSVKERDIVIDIETRVNSSKEVVSLEILDGQLEKVVSFTVCGMPIVVDELANGEISMSLPINVKNASEISSDLGKSAKKDSLKSSSAKKPPKPPRPPRSSLDAADQKHIKEMAKLPINVKNASENSSDLGKSAKKDSHKSTSAKKPPKPPRPPRSSLDAADQKLIKEMAELAMIKSARLKMLKKMKSAKASSSASASSSGNLVALLFTVLFCIVIIFKGLHSSGMHPRNNTTIHIHGSSESKSQIGGNNIVVQVQNQQNLSTSNAPLISAGSPF